MPRGFPLQDEGPGMNQLFHDLTVAKDKEAASMKTTKEMRARIRELATQRDDFDRAVNMLLTDFETPQMFDLGDGRVVHFNPAGRFHGWVFRRHPDGQFVSEGALRMVPLPEFTF